MLTINHLSIWYQQGKNIIDNASFSVNERSVVGLLGINGAGKSTLINTLSDVHDQFSVSKITFRDQSCQFSAEDFKLSRYTVFTEEQAFMYWTFADYLAFVARAYHKTIDPAYLEFLITGFNFASYQKYALKDLSTGNRKKVFLITGFALQLPLLILDEPLDGLDFNSSEFLYTAINDYKQFGSILMSSHIAESFSKTCDYILLLSHGKIKPKKISRGSDLRAQLGGWLDE